MNEHNNKVTQTVLIVNPSSSSGSTGKGWEDLVSKIKEIFGETPEVVFTEKGGDGTSLTRDYLTRGFKKVVAIGGDGTINEVANGFFILEEEEKRNGDKSTAINEIGSHHSDYDDKSFNYDSKRVAQKPKQKQKDSKIFPRAPTLRPTSPEAIMGILPSGTRNVLAKSLNLSADVVECCQNFTKSKPKKIDVISTTVNNPDATHRPKTTTKIFLNAAEIGIGAEIIDRSKKVKSKIKNRLISTLTGILTTIPIYRSNMSEIVIDDGREKILTKLTMGVIANGKYLGGGIQAAPNANVSDGLLDIVILKNSGSLKMLDELSNMKTGNYNNEGDIIYRQAKKVSINSKERNVAVTLDGEPLGILPATFQVYQSAINLIV
jgi:YegS/Rv2252/BmrU family lipid kinase